MACIQNNGLVECMPIWHVVVITLFCYVVLMVLYHIYLKPNKKKIKV